MTGVRRISGMVAVHGFVTSDSEDYYPMIISSTLAGVEEEVKDKPNEESDAMSTTKRKAKLPITPLQHSVPRHIQLAQIIWLSPELRRSIISFMTNKDLLEYMTLSRVTFEDVVLEKYRIFDMTGYYGLVNCGAALDRQQLYHSSVRVLDIRTSFPLLTNIYGAAHLLTIFPNVHRIFLPTVELVRGPNHTSQKPVFTQYYNYQIDLEDILMDIPAIIGDLWPAHWQMKTEVDLIATSTTTGTTPMDWVEELEQTSSEVKIPIFDQLYVRSVKLSSPRLQLRDVELLIENYSDRICRYDLYLSAFGPEDIDHLAQVINPAVTTTLNLSTFPNISSGLVATLYGVCHVHWADYYGLQNLSIDVRTDRMRAGINTTEDDTPVSNLVKASTEGSHLDEIQVAQYHAPNHTSAGDLPSCNIGSCLHLDTLTIRLITHRHATLGKVKATQAVLDELPSASEVAKILLAIGGPTCVFHVEVLDPYWRKSVVSSWVNTMVQKELEVLNERVVEKKGWARVTH